MKSIFPTFLLCVFFRLHLFQRVVRELTSKIISTYFLPYLLKICLKMLKLCFFVVFVSLVLISWSMCAQPCPTVYDPMDGSPPGSSVHGIFQARVLKWVAMPFSRISFQPRDQTCVSFTSCIGRQILTTVPLGKSTKQYLNLSLHWCVHFSQFFCL